MLRIEPLSSVPGQRSGAHDTLLAPKQDVFLDIVDSYAQHPHVKAHTIFQDYLQAPKQLGAIDTGSILFYTALSRAVGQDVRMPRNVRIDAYEYHSSMLWESAFIESLTSHNHPDTAMARIELVDAGSESLKHAASLLRHDDMERTQRLLIKNLFTQPMRDVVCGEVTDATRDELLLSIRDARSQLKFIPNPSDRNGVLGELLTLEAYWSDYQGQGSKVALPATVRGGHGGFHPDQTHDIDIIKQRHDDSWTVLTPVEVKNQPITEEIRKRYTQSHLANIVLNGTVIINGDHRQAAV